MSTRLGRMSTSGQPGDEAGISQRGQEGKWTERQPQDGQAFSLHLSQQDENPNVLPLAAMHGNAGAVRVLLGAGANLEARTGGLTPLHLAASSGGTEAVTALLEAGANLEARNEDGNTPLHMAALGETAGAVTVLTRAGADLEARAEGGNTPLHMAALGGNAETVTALLEAGADPKARDNSDELPFDYARDNEKLQGTDAYWKLNEARFP